MSRKLFFSAMVLSVLLCSSLVVSVNAASMWSRTYGGTGDDRAYSLVATSDGGYAIAGDTNSFGAGSNDFWLVKTDALGNMEWNRTYGGTGYDWASSVVATSDGGYAIGGTWNYLYDNDPLLASYCGDFWLVKTDANGVMEWNRTYGGTGNDRASSLVATQDGGYALAGRTNSISPGGDYDYWLVKTDAFGGMLWNRTYGPTLNASQTHGTADDWASSVVATADGGYAIAGTWNYTSFVGGVFGLVKTDAFGNMQWNKTYGGIWSSEASSLVATSDGGYALAGYAQFSGSTDFWLVKTDSFGNMEWNKTYGEPATSIERANSLVVTSDGGYAIAGDIYPPSGSGRFFWLVKVDPLGNMEWNHTYERGENDIARSLVLASDGGYALAGYTSSEYQYDFWVVKTDEFGVIPEYSSWLVPALVLTATAFIIINKKKLLYRSS